MSKTGKVLLGVLVVLLAGFGIFTATTTGLALLNVVVIIACAVIGFMRSKTGNIEIHTSVWDEDPVEEPAPAQE